LISGQTVAVFIKTKEDFIAYPVFDVAAFFQKTDLLDKPEIFPRDFSQILQGAGAAAELVVGVVLGHGDAVYVDVHGSQPVELESIL
jgi:hypothetical protein